MPRGCVCAGARVGSDQPDAEHQQSGRVVLVRLGRVWLPGLAVVRRGGSLVRGWIDYVWVE